MSRYDKFYVFLEDLYLKHKELSRLLLSKFDAVSMGDVARLEEISKDEQAFVLYTKSFETNLKKYREQLSLTGEKLQDIVEELPEEEQPRFQDLAKTIQVVLYETKELNTKCQHLLEEKIRVIGDLKKRQGVTATSGSQPSGKDGKAEKSDSARTPGTFLKRV